ncbi:podoplanin isoform X2 [Clinocottus analis]
MNVQLMLLLALAGPFCAFTHASPTEIPEELHTAIDEIVADIAPEVTDAPKEELTLITGPPATEPAAAPEEVPIEEVATTEVVTEAAPPASTVNTEEAVVETEAAATEAPEPIITDPPVVETAEPTETATVEVLPTGAAKVETGEDGVVVEDTEEGLSSGQVAGIVIGALLAVVIVIAVVIAVVRRMGKYS